MQKIPALINCPFCGKELTTKMCASVAEIRRLTEQVVNNHVKRDCKSPKRFEKV